MQSFKLLWMFLGLMVAISLPQLGQSQTAPVAEAQAASSSEAMASTKNSATNVRAGTKIAAELSSTVDARTAKPRDKVEARVTKNLKQNGRIVINKGDRLVGHITEVQAGSTADAGSRMAIAFDQLVSGESTSQLNAVMTSVLSTPNEESAPGQDMMGLEPMPVGGPARSGGSRGPGGGGLSSPVNSTVNAAGSTVGPEARGVGTAAGTTRDATTSAATRGSLGSSTGTTLATPIRDIRVQSESHAEQGTSTTSVLSTRHGNLRLESGTRMQFRVAAQAESGGETK